MEDEKLATTSSEAGHILVEAAKTMREEDPDWHVIVLAVGENTSYLVAISDDLQIDNAITALERTKFQLLMHDADYEDFPDLA